MANCGSHQGQQGHQLSFLEAQAGLVILSSTFCFLLCFFSSVCFCQREVVHSTMKEGLPIALRRTPRRQQRRGQSPEMMSLSRSAARGLRQRSTAALRTPTGGPRGVHGREQASGPELEEQDQYDADHSTITVLDFETPVRTGPSPMSFKRKRQRHSTGTHGTPSKRPRQAHDGVGAHGTEDECETVNIFPLRQVLDGRIRRRIRRNGLSEEMNTIFSEKRTRRKRTEQELRRLHDEMASKDAELERLRGFESSLTIFGSEGCDTSRIQELERHLTRLKQAMNHASSAAVDSSHFDDSGVGMSDGLWEHDSDDGGMMDVDDDGGFGNRTAAELQRNTTPENPARAWASDTSSPRITRPRLISPPSTSPTKPVSPIMERQQRHHHTFSSSTIPPKKIMARDAALPTYTTTSDTATQAYIPDPERATMEEELTTLRSELASLSGALQAQEAQMREKLSENQQGCDDMDLDLQLDIVLQDLAGKTASLAELQSSLSSLLSPRPPTDYNNNNHNHDRSNEEENDTASQMTLLKGLAETLRSVRVELQDLSPGEALPDGAAEVLDLAVQRLRGLGREVRERDEALRERDALISHRDEALRQRDAMIYHQDEIIRDGDRQLDERDTRIAHKDARISGLELDVERLTGTVADLEAQARRLGEGQAALRGDLEAEKEASSRAGDALRDAEAGLADVLGQAAELKAQLAERDTQVGQRDSRIAGLRAEVERLGGALAEAHGQLRVARGEASRDRVAASNAVVAMRAQLLQALSVGEGFLGMSTGAGSGSRSGSGSELSFDSAAGAAVPKEEPGLGSDRGRNIENSMKVGGGNEKGMGRVAGRGVDLVAFPDVPTGEFVTREGGKLDGMIGDMN